MGELSQSEVQREEAQSGLLQFAQAWDSSMTPFCDWLARVSRAYQSCRMNLLTASRLVEAREAEVWAALRLASLEDDALALLDDEPLPKTVWLLLADCDAEGIRVAMEALRGKVDGQQSATVVRRALNEHCGPSPEDAVAGLPGATVSRMAKKLTEYDQANDWSIKFLKSIGGKLKRGTELTGPQRTKLVQVLSEMAEKGYVRRDSPDGDVRECGQVLDALGRD